MPDALGARTIFLVLERFPWRQNHHLQESSGCSSICVATDPVPFRMKFSTILSAVCTALLFAGCASKSDKPLHVELRGFSFTAPAAVKDEKQWGVAKRTPDLLILGKPGEF